jgi:hypothetical protein
LYGHAENNDPPWVIYNCVKCTDKSEKLMATVDPNNQDLIKMAAALGDYYYYA